MIKILGISGSRVQDGNMEALLDRAMSQIDRYEDVSGEVVNLSTRKIHGCLHCNWCIRSQTEGRWCVQDDDMTSIYPKLEAADGLILACPAHFGRLSGVMADLIDRLRVFVHGNIYKNAMKNKIGGALAVSFFRGGGLETTLFSLTLVFFTLQMIAANSGLYQLGAGAFTSREGQGRFEKEHRHIVLEDDYGVMSAQLLVDRVIELARIFKAGRKALNQS